MRTKMKTKKAVSPLLRILKFWELIMWLLDLRKTAAKSLPATETGMLELLTLPKRNWRHFREFLTRIHSEGYCWEDWSTEPSEEYWNILEKFGAKKEKGLNYIFKAPAVLASWTLCSRRTFKLTADLQVVLAATSLKGVDWAKFCWPFNSFLIELEVPLIMNGIQFDSIMVSNEDQFLGNNRMTVKLIPSSLLSRDEIGTEKRSALEKLSRHNARRFRAGYMEFFVSCMEEAYMIDLNIWEKVDEDAFRSGDISSFEELPHERKVVFRILFGLVLFLQTREGRQSSFKPNVANDSLPGNERLITDGEEVCHIGNTITLTDEVFHRFADVMDGIGTEHGPTYVMGHWRRPPGFGSIPTAEKSVLVLPYITHKELIAEGLPVGTSTTVVRA